MYASLGFGQNLAGVKTKGYRLSLAPLIIEDGWCMFARDTLVLNWKDVLDLNSYEWLIGMHL